MQFQRLSITLIVPLIITGVIAVTTCFPPHDVLAQQSERPLVPPSLRDEPRTPTSILFAADPDCPVSASGMVALGQTTSGEGSLVLKNVSGKPIAAISGTFSYDTTRGPVSYPWHESFLGSIAGSLTGPRRYFAPGEESSVPLVPLNITTGNDRIKDATVSVTGVLYADGTVWGEKGEAVRKRFLDQAAASRYDLDYKILAAYNRLTPQEFEQEIKSGPIRIGQVWLNQLLQKGLLDEKGRLRPDALDRLRKMIANLENPFEK